MRKIVTAAMCAVLLAASPSCAQPSAPAKGDEASAAAAEPAQAGGGGGESEADFRARCRRDILAQTPDAAAWVDGVCEENWGKVAAAGPIAEAIVAIGGAGAGDAAAVRARAPMVQWMSRPEQGNLAQGTLAGMAVTMAANPAGEVAFLWSEMGALSPYDVEQALRGRGVGLTLIGCLAYGAGENTKVFRAAPAGASPFALTIYDRAAPTANAWSTYSANVNVTGRVPSLAQLNARGEGYEAACP